MTFFNAATALSRSPLRWYATPKAFHAFADWGSKAVAAVSPIFQHSGEVTGRPAAIEGA